MKFYYNGQLIRTSKSHVYSHAVINIETGAVIGCRANEKAAQSLKDSYISRNQQGIENANRAIKAIEAGKKYYTVIAGRDRYQERISGGIEKYNDWIDNNEKAIERIRTNWKVVELEAREK